MRHPRGFTLLELLVAIAIMAVVGLLSWQVLRTVIQAREVSAVHLDRLDALQRCLQLMDADFVQAVQRPITDSFGGPLPALISYNDGQGVLGVEFTRTGWLNPMHETRSNLLRVRYEQREGELHRLDWVYLDRAPGVKPEDLVVLSGVRNLQIRYLDASYQWQSIWPEPMDAQKAVEIQPMPLAVDISFDSHEFGHLRKLVRLPIALGANNAP